MQNNRKIVLLKMGDLRKYSHPDYDILISQSAELPETDYLICEPVKGDQLPQLEKTKAVIISGSSLILTDEHSWKEQVLSWVSKLITEDIPTLGICFGHQILAAASGGKVANNPSGIELGTKQVHLTEAGSQDILLGELAPSFSVQESHIQSVLEAPAGAIILAYNEHDSYQALRYGKHVWGVQFHPEFEPDIMRKIILNKAQDEKHNIKAAKLIGYLKETSASRGLLKRFINLLVDLP